jgi:uncharacterized protein (DUF849 family)
MNDRRCRVFLEAALNGTRTLAEHPAIPVKPEEQAREARAAVDEGASAIHVHVRGADGRESLESTDVAQTLDAIRAVCPDVPIGICVGAWIVPDLCRRFALIRSWTRLPDFVSVNFHEAGATETARRLLGMGIELEAGIWNAPAACTLIESGLTDSCLRILIEPAEGSRNVRGNLEQIESALTGTTQPRLLHGLGASAWELVDLAAKRRYQARMGFEDTLMMPDGTRANSNADLIAAARRILLSADLDRATGSHFAVPRSSPSSRMS